jgi:hypothetical protein
MKTNLDADPRAATTLAMVRCGPSQNIELFEYEAKDRVKVPMKNSDIGGFHLAFYVKDLGCGRLPQDRARRSDPRRSDASRGPLSSISTRLGALSPKCQTIRTRLSGP